MSDSNNTNPPNIGQSSALLMPNRYKDHWVAVKRDFPGVIIVIHGVNDVGVSYGAVDAGLCAGLNERLDRPDFYPNDYLLPKDGNEVVADPDAILYRKLPNANTYSPVIPFYWGYRADSDHIGKHDKNGQHVDIFGNRLDRQYAKNGGMFANATNNIPDMFSGHFDAAGVTTPVANLTQDPAHHLFTAPDRRYMVLAAMRLAALIAQIHTQSEDETITLVGHSQGTLISLLAQGILKQQGKERYADTLILCNSPYSIKEPTMERVQSGDLQQTTSARLETLDKLIALVTTSPHKSPEPAELKHGLCSNGRVGDAWSPTEGKRLAPQEANSDDDRDETGNNNLADPAPAITFPERDNRGKAYIYFCPQDMTVDLRNVEGIGTQGLPPLITHEDTQGNSKTSPVWERFAARRVFQRVWSWRLRHGQRVRVGDPALKEYPLLESHERSFDVNSPTIQAFSRETFMGEAPRSINAEPLAPPFLPDLHVGDIGAANHETPAYQGKQSDDQIDAQTALVSMPEVADPAALQKKIQTEKKYEVENSYHSAIMVNPEHHRWVTAMDVALGQAKSLDDPDWRQLLIAIADWRTEFTDELAAYMPKFNKLEASVLQLVKDTYKYYKTGTLPTNLPVLDDLIKVGVIVSEVRAGRQRNVASHGRGRA